MCFFSKASFSVFSWELSPSPFPKRSCSPLPLLRGVLSIKHVACQGFPRGKPPPPSSKPQKVAIAEREKSVVTRLGERRAPTGGSPLPRPTPPEPFLPSGGRQGGREEGGFPHAAPLPSALSRCPLGSQEATSAIPSPCPLRLPPPTRSSCSILLFPPLGLRMRQGTVGTFATLLAFLSRHVTRAPASFHLPPFAFQPGRGGARGVLLLKRAGWAGP